MLRLRVVTVQGAGIRGNGIVTLGAQRGHGDTCPREEESRPGLAQPGNCRAFLTHQGPRSRTTHGRRGGAPHCFISLLPPSSLPLLMARGLPSPLVFLDSEQGSEIRKLAWELQSSSDPEDSSTKGTELICVAFCKTGPLPAAAPAAKQAPAHLHFHSSSTCPRCGRHSLSSPWGRLHPAATPKRQLSPPDLTTLPLHPHLSSLPHTPRGPQWSCPTGAEHLAAGTLAPCH